MELQVRVDHGTLATNQPLNLRTAATAEGPYHDQLTLEGGRGRRATFRVPSPGPAGPGPQAPSASAAPRFFQIVMP